MRFSTIKSCSRFSSVRSVSTLASFDCRGMAAGMSLSSAARFKPCRFGQHQYSSPMHRSVTDRNCLLFSSPATRRAEPDVDVLLPMSSSRHLAVSFVTRNDRTEIPIEGGGSLKNEISEEKQIAAARYGEKLARKRSERTTYLIAAMMSSFGITSMAIAAVYCRFSWQMEGGEVPVSEMFGTFALAVGAAVGMEFWARWAHKELWHASLWHMHESHHRPREGPFELNDVFAITNAVPAIGLLSYGFFNKGLVPGLCFGAGLGITVFGMAYMFVHDGLVHHRFPVGPIANVPYFRRVAAAHQIHHTDAFNGVPFGLFLGPDELEEVGAAEELEKEIKKRIKHSRA